MNGKIRNMQLYIRSMGKLLKVEAVFGTALDDIADANAMMEKDNQLAVVAECDGLVILANRYDQGITGNWAAVKPVGDYVAIAHSDTDRHTMSEAQAAAGAMNLLDSEGLGS